MVGWGRVMVIRAVVSRDMSRSRDTIFQSLGREGVKSWSRDLEVSENEHVSRLFLKIRFKIERRNLN